MGRKHLEVWPAPLVRSEQHPVCGTTLQEQVYRAQPERACPQGCRYDFNPAIPVLAQYQCRAGHAFCACCLLSEGETPASGSKCPACKGKRGLTAGKR